MPPDAAAFQRRATRRLLERHIDFDFLNAAEIEVTVTALDAESGKVVDFRNTEAPLTVDHLLASSALPILFQPVWIGGRHFFDAGLAENLPLRPLLDRSGRALILGCDLFDPVGALRHTLDGVADRAQELAFGCQSRSIIASRDLQGRRFRHVILSDPADVFAGKAFDYSLTTMHRRQALGYRVMREVLAEIDTKNPSRPPDDPFLATGDSR